MRRRSSLAMPTLVLVALAIAPLALAQTTTKRQKKGTKPAASASASAAAAPDPTPEPPAPPPPPTDTGAAETKSLPVTPPEKEWDVTDTKEEPSKRYLFVGLRYRGDVIPKFMINMFVNGGRTIYSNAVGLELDSRKDGFSTVFALTYQNYGTGDMLFLQRDRPAVDSNYSVVNSSLGAVYASVDLLWSLPIDTSHHWDFEYGVGVGLGVVFGNLGDNWVYNSGATGAYYDPTTNQHFNKCQSTSDGPGCIPGSHTNPSPAKVGNYTEPAGIAGPKPILFPMFNFPQLGVRYKPVKNFQARLGIGFSLTGFWFGVSGDYGLEKKEQAKAETAPSANKASGTPSLHGML